jgi:hypothetical protein
VILGIVDIDFNTSADTKVSGKLINKLSSPFFEDCGSC